MPLTCLLLLVLGADEPGSLDALRPALAAYRADLDAVRKAHGGARALPAVRFFLFGMGNRRKLIYQDGALRDARTGETLRRWDVAEDLIVPPSYTVGLRTRDGRDVRIVEDEAGVWLVENGHRTALRTESRLSLPTFEGHPHAPVLRVLHQELLINVVDGRPVPNLFVYPRPWYRDGAMMAMAFRKTGNVGLLRDWILGLREPFDRNNAGQTEPDNLGQALYLVSLVSDRSHPLVEIVRREVPARLRDGHLTGDSDFAPHPVYQTKWLKFGLRSLGLEDPYTIPRVADSYSSLFWWDYTDQHVATGSRHDSGDYPYLTWADDHFYGQHKGPLGDRDYPLTWEAKASQADYAKLGILSDGYVKARLAAPHSWHAAEAFLRLMDETH